MTGDDASFEELRRELDEIIERLERGDVAIDDAVRLWQRGEELYRLCAEKLEAVEGRVEELSLDESRPPERP